MSVEKVQSPDKVNYTSLHHRKEGYLSIKIKDTGPGIDRAYLNRIFEPYFTTKEIGKGSGLGLAVVHGIVKNHQGEIYVDSQKGSGTTFTILIPCVDMKSEEHHAEESDMLIGDETVLFVDDEPALLRMGKLMLSKMGYTVETHSSPEEAIEQFESEPDRFHIVVTDMTMPKITGLELFTRMRQIRNEIPVIICTGHNSYIDQEKADQMGISGYATKPVSMVFLGKMIRDVLDEKVVN